MSKLNDLNQRLANIGFHGSYRPEDVTFLMNVSDIQPTSVEEKEYLIQSGKMHYSQMISVEDPPTEAQRAHFDHAFEHGALRLAIEVQKLGNALRKRFENQPIVLVSLVRAGVPLGVLLKHHLSQTNQCYHYGISIIRDRGIDFGALQAIIEQHGAENIVFVDGWTGKGAICKQLTESLKDFPVFFDQDWAIPRLVTLSDLAGYSWLSASCDDWLIPFGILGSVISGLTSRTILEDSIDLLTAQKNWHDPQYWHNCLIYKHLETFDISVNFVKKILELMHENQTDELPQWSNAIRLHQQKQCKDTIDWISNHYHIQNINRIKPSIAEATRAVLRRVPERILLRDETDPHVQLLLHFAQEKNIPVDILGSKLGPYHAVTLIKKVEKNQ